MAPSYAAHLKSSDWAQKRRDARDLAGNKCEYCGSDPDEVHHTSYEHLGSPEELDDLIVLCRQCHCDVHDGKIGSGEIDYIIETREAKR